MMVSEEELKLMARTYPSDVATSATMGMAQELLAARWVVDAARRLLADGKPEPLEDALAAYDETTR